MVEIVTPLIELAEGETHTADADGAAVITGKHSHSDVLRYVISDIGHSEALCIMQGLAHDA